MRAEYPFMVKHTEESLSSIVIHLKTYRLRWKQKVVVHVSKPALSIYSRKTYIYLKSVQGEVVASMPAIFRA